MCSTIASKTFAYIVIAINSVFLIAWLLSVILFGSSCGSDCFNAAYIVVFLVINPILLYGYGYLLAYISWRKQDIGPQKGALQTWQTILSQIAIIISFALSLLNVLVLAIGGM